ncbi:uncharacterized protein LOC115729615 [Rhodamnia argentea]|uniref:Uncharacterized protein LOC115729615 n=1 Tax=Rhodamnia argentea TaxID=178133 RepID=A0A8B8N149_9MYRT|nr:uncharacterized protein LOC115729615 [Rhodamnia argentea]
MDRGGRLRKSFNAYVVAQKAWFENQYNLDLTIQERQEFHDALELAQNDFDQIMDLIREYDVLVLDTISEARAFVSVLPQFLNNRGNLKCIKVAKVVVDSKKDICRGIRHQLESAGLGPRQTNLNYRIP